jgi:mediator of RNA polymerase II transcription subunit 25
MVSTTDTNAETLCDIIFLIEGTAVNGAYMNEMKTNYIVPILEHFSKGVLDALETYTSDKMSKFGAVVFKTAQAMPNVCCSTFGPYNTSQKLHSVIEGLELSDGKSESNANLAEGMATALMCFEELDEKRDRNVNVQKFCILICNSPPYTMPGKIKILYICYVYNIVS